MRVHFQYAGGRSVAESRTFGEIRHNALKYGKWIGTRCKGWFQAWLDRFEILLSRLSPLH
jgi:hypothetical protein